MCCKNSRLYHVSFLSQPRLPMGWKPAVRERDVVSFLSISSSFFLLSTNQSEALTQDGLWAFYVPSWPCCFSAPVGVFRGPLWDLTSHSPLTWVMQSLTDLLCQPLHLAPEPVCSLDLTLVGLPHSVALLCRAPSRCIQDQSLLSTWSMVYASILECTTCPTQTIFLSHLNKWFQLSLLALVL